MSILLDALKKSEEQRQLGTTPGIHSPPGQNPGPDLPAQPWIPAVLVAASALAIAWFGWEQYRPPAGVAAAPVVVTAQQEPATGSDQVDPGAPAAATTGTPRASRRTPVESFRVEGESLQAATDMPPAAEPPARPGDSTAIESVRDYSATPNEPAGAADPAASALTGAAAAAPGRDEPRPARSRATEPITFWELPQGVRDSLPDLRITVLVFAEQPEDRFILLGGQRLVEKDEVQAGVVLEEIRREGAVFLYRNYRFLVKG